VIFLGREFDTGGYGIELCAVDGHGASVRTTCHVILLVIALRQSNCS
jgi:hypothetical protein